MDGYGWDASKNKNAILSPAARELVSDQIKVVSTQKRQIIKGRGQFGMEDAE